ncbi:MAG: hypothetical protein JWR10_4455 [Rubritepida sp.]|nr:hypothetical protein [Rubritepida sp.]
MVALRLHVSRPGDSVEEHGMAKYFYIAATLALTVFGQLMLKWRALAHAAPASGRKLDYLVAMYTDIGVLSGLACALLASVVWALAIEKAPISVAYPFMALSFVLTPLGAALFFDDLLSPVQIVGMGLIVLGISLTAFGN